MFNFLINLFELSLKNNLILLAFSVKYNEYKYNQLLEYFQYTILRILLKILNVFFDIMKMYCCTTVKKLSLKNFSKISRRTI